VNQRQPVTDIELNALLDGETTHDDRMRLETLVLEDPEARERLKGLKALDQRLKGTFTFVLEQPVPERLAAVVPRGMRRRRWKQIRTAAAIAASLLIAFAAGYATRMTVNSKRTAQFVETAMGAHRVFTPEVRHPVEVAAAEEKHLVAWLGKRLGQNIKAPALSQAGFTLVGGRLLSDRAEPAAQLMYEDGKGRRLTLFIRRESRESTSFQFASQDGVQAFYWIDRPLAYALVGKISRDELMLAARLTYEQLDR
jgi:anti-sigma factor RsiW